MTMTADQQRTEEEARFKLALRSQIQASAAAKAGGPSQVSALQPLAVRLLGEFHRAALDRRMAEERWLRDLRQYLGQYEPEQEAARCYAGRYAARSA